MKSLPRTLAVLLAFTCAEAASAAELELAGYAGLTLPFYEQTFPIDLRPPERPIQGIQIRQEQPLQLNAKGGLVLAGGATLYLAGAFGIEARYDSADVDITADPPVYSLRLSSPFPNFETTLQPAPTVVTISALTPVSLNLKLRTPGSVRFFVSGGVSRLPSFEFTLDQRIGLGVTGINVITRQATISSVGISGALTPVGNKDAPNVEGGSRWGGNLGGGLQFSLGKNVTLLAEARYFYFPSQEFEWSVDTDRTLTSIEQALLDATLSRVPLVEFKPQFFQVTGGITLSF